jgi:pimeloyl-ACP methyl ester carboxylesterase
MALGYRRFAERRRAELRADSELAETSAGLVEYACIGPATGRTVLYFHGSPGGHDQVHVLDRLAGQGCRILGWSRPGYLRTPLEVGRTIAEQADAAAALLDELGLPTVVAYAVSGGGPAAIEFARRHPLRTDALVLESAISGHYAPAISPPARRLYLNAYGTWLVTTLADRWPRAAVAGFVREESSLSSRARSAVVDWILADSERMRLVRAVLASLTPYEDRVAGLENDLRQWALLDDSLTSGVTCPTLVLHGSHDGDADPAHARHAAGTIPNARLHLVNEGWHLLPLSVDGHTAEAELDAFLRRLARRA